MEAVYVNRSCTQFYSGPKVPLKLGNNGLQINFNLQICYTYFHIDEDSSICLNFEYHTEHVT
jgi:hypothetical protein